MAQSLNTFDDKSTQKIAETVRSHGRDLVNLRNLLANISVRRHEANYKQPGIYVVKTGVGGIPAATINEIDGIDVLTTGTGDASLYRFTADSDSIELTPFATREIHNISLEAVAAETWCIVYQEALTGKFVIDKSTFGFIEFTLTANMSGSSATATVVNFWGRDPGSSSVTVWDTQACFPRALSGASGIATWDGKRAKYIVIECQSKAGWVEFTLTADMSGGSSSSATVNDYGGSQQDVQSPGSTVTIYDPHTIFKYALSGAKGYAVYDQLEDKYTAVTCQQRTMNLRGTLSGAITAATTSVTITSPVAMDHSPFNQAPVGTVTAYNVFDFTADSGAEVYVRWNEAATQWELIVAPCPA